MLPLSSNTQRQGVLMAPDGPWWPLMAPARVPGWPLAAPLRVFSLLSPSCNHAARPEYRGRGRRMWLVRVLWKDVWNRSMGIRGLGSAGGLLCWRLSPLLASMISSIDREVLLRSRFFKVSLPLPFCRCLAPCVSSSPPFSSILALRPRSYLTLTCVRGEPITSRQLGVCQFTPGSRMCLHMCSEWPVESDPMSRLCVQINTYIVSAGKDQMCF